MAITNIVTTDTFRTWFERTNEVIDFLNNSVIGDGLTAYGVFTIGANSNTSLAVCNTFLVNTSIIQVKANTTLAANVTVSANANVFNLAAGSLILQPINGTVVNSAITINASATLLGAIAANSTLLVNGATTLNSTVGITGTTTANGIVARQLLFSHANSIVAATLTDPGYADYAPTGIAEAAVLNLTPNINTVFSGIQAPTSLGTTGARVLYIQNLSSTYKITLTSANSSSAANNQFKTNGDSSVDVPPGTALAVIWTTANKQWRPLSPAVTITSLSLTGDATVGGNLTVNGAATFSNTANTSFAPTLYIDQTNHRVGVNTASPTVEFQVTGNTILQVTTINGLLTLTANLSSSKDSAISNNALTLTANTLNATFGNTFTANSSSQSYVRNLLTTTFTSNQSATFANTIINGNSSVAGVFSITGASARLVVPVGTGKYAT